MAEGSNPIDPVKLDRLAEVAIKVGLRLEPGQDLILTAPMSALPLVRKIVEHAYKAGAGIVQPIFADEEITLNRYRFAQDASFDKAPGWLFEGMAKAFEGNAARLAAKIASASLPIATTSLSLGNTSLAQAGVG